LEGRESFIKTIFKDYKKYYGRKVQMGDISLKVPFLRKYAFEKIENYFTSKHAGQVISLEDAVNICSIPGRVSLVDCPCRKYILGKNEKKCILCGATAEIVDNIPEFSPVQDIGAEDAAELLRGFNKSGLVQTIWTFKTPYIGTICNCNNAECMLFHLKNHYKSINIVRKGHEVASINPEICDGCGNCQRTCQFGAIAINGKKAEANHNCHGCGVCRHFCPVGAIQLIPKIR
jgi:NAD-dependent dihydropyrimidine dehydrogenase PreA subunit